MPFFLAGLAVLFVGLKLTNYIDWSWFWVLSPVLAPVSFALFLMISGGILIGGASIVDWFKKSRR